MDRMLKLFIALVFMALCYWISEKIYRWIDMKKIKKAFKEFEDNGKEE